MSKAIFVIIFGLLIQLFSQTAIAPSAGDGSEGNPYQIANLENLYWITADKLNWDKNYIQTSDIDASETRNWFDGTGWKPIGSGFYTPFKGTYNGQNHNIDRLYIYRNFWGEIDCIGLFGLVENGTIQNLNVSNIEIITGGDYTGALAGYIRDYYSGQNSYIINCSSSGRISVDGEYVGGLVGYSTRNSSITKSSSSISIYPYSSPSSRLSSRYVGGCVGYNSSGSIINECYSTGTVQGYYYVGGLVGFNYGSQIEKSYSSGSVFGYYYVGGLVGINDNYDSNPALAMTNDCFSYGKVKGYEYVGGLAGRNQSNSAINNSYSFCKVEGSNYVGGFLGYNNCTSSVSVSNCYSIGEVAGSTSVGGLIGYNSGSEVYASFWDTEASRISISAAGTGKSTSEMKTESTFSSAGWNFSSIWKIVSTVNLGYPYFWLQTTFSPPLLNTLSVTEVNVTNATGGGYILSKGETDIIQHGLCWSTKRMPSINDSRTEEGPISDVISFYSYMNNLIRNTIYYVRAYATNSYGTSYGNEISFRTDPFDPEDPPGSGTESDPYIVSTLEDLYWISIDSTRWDYHYTQTADIDASETYDWNQGGLRTIGNLSINFSGSYNGNEYMISEFKLINDDYKGLFGVTNNAIIKNINLKNLFISGQYAGALIGLSKNSTIDNCNVLSSQIDGIEFTGGLIGYSDNSNIINCYSDCYLYPRGNYCGGITGYSKISIIENCCSISTINVLTNIDYEFIGGLIGYNEESTVNKCFSEGFIKGNNYSGGLIGYNSNSEVTNCYSVGQIIGNYYTGGLIGYNTSSLLNDCFSARIVSGNDYFGGLVGADAGSSVNNSFWDIEISGQTLSGGGEGKTTFEMKTLSTFTDAGWDYTNIWDMDGTTNSGYPYIIGVPVGLESETNVPKVITLSQNYPNPFNPETKITFSIPSAQDVKLSVYNSNGQLVRKLINEKLSAGKHSKQFNGDKLNSGIYFYTLQTGDKKLTRKMLLIK